VDNQANNAKINLQYILRRLAKEHKAFNQVV